MPFPSSKAKPRALKPPKPPKPRKAPKPFKAKAKASRRPGLVGQHRPRGGKTIEHLCGHKQVHVLTGPAWKKDRTAEHEASRICTACWAEERAKELESFFDLTEWPVLEGTIAQVLWARSLRATALLAYQGEAAVVDRERRDAGLEPASNRYMAIVAAAMFKETRAKWWIDSHEAKDFHRDLLTFGDLDALKGIQEEARLIPVCPF